MKKTITILTTLVLLLTSCTHAEHSTDCLEDAITQMDMNECTGSSLKQADAELNRVYGELQSNYAKDKLFLEKLKKAQLAWIKVRDADFEMQFPHHNEGNYYGSIFPVCANSYKQNLTLERVAFLKTWLVGAEEGDSCNGSKRMQDVQSVQKSDKTIKVCYQSVSRYKDTPNGKDIVNLFLTINKGEVQGKYTLDYYDDSQYTGQVSGNIKGGSIDAKYHYKTLEQQATTPLKIKLNYHQAEIMADETIPENRVFSNTLRQVCCK